jgi:hypothetical protein
MSVTVSNCDEICNNPSNNSTAKMLYSFPKKSRFNSRKIILYFWFLFRCDNFYDIPSSVKSARTTTMGFGNKYDFTREYHFYLNSDPLNLLPLTLILLKVILIRTLKMGLDLEREEAKWKLLGLWSPLKKIKILGRDPMLFPQLWPRMPLL